MDTANLQKLILTARKPIVLSGINIPWYFFNMSIEEWLASMHKQLPDVQFQLGRQKYWHSPQMEYERELSSEVDLGSFLEYSRSPQQQIKWATFSYKYLKDFPAIGDNGKVNMRFLGFPEIQEDISFWLGSRGAHTPCHHDTYGRNVVVQVYGTKRWILFDPKTDLLPTRIPYEESSVYSSQTFFSPSPKHLVDDALVDKAYIVDLKPGDILIVPPKWWHYVESLDVSLALNAWIPMIEDRTFIIEECLIKDQISKMIPDDLIDEMVFSMDGREDLRDYKARTDQFKLDLLAHLYSVEHETVDMSSGKLRKYYESDLDAPFDATLLNPEHAKFVEISSTEAFKDIILANAMRFCPKMAEEWSKLRQDKRTTLLLHSLIDGFCAPEVIKKIVADIRDERYLFHMPVTGASRSPAEL